MLRNYSVILRIFLIFMVFHFWGCAAPEDEESRIVTVKLFLNHGNHSERNLKTNVALTEGIGTELIGVVPSGVGFNQNYNNDSNITNWSLTDLQRNSIILRLPLNQTL